MKKLFPGKGVTLIEVLIALSLGVIVLAVVLNLWDFSYRAWFAERAKSEILGKLEIGMEWIKKDLMTSNGNEVFFYPADSASYSAISFPAAVDDDGDGFIELDDNGTPNDASDDIIQWDRTVIYHVYDTETDSELRKTVFSPRSDLSDTQRQNQLEDVAVNGEAVAGTPNGANASTRTLISQPLISGGSSILLDISPQLREFDGYSSSVARSPNISFGSIVIGSGYHTLTFETLDKNGSSTSYGMGIDLFRITPSGSDREGEDYTFLTHPDGTAGISATSGDVYRNEDMTPYGKWSGDRQLDYEADGIGDFVTLRFYNDVWRKSNFDLGSADRVIVEYSDRNGVFDGGTGVSDTIVRLEGGGEIWDSTEQAGAQQRFLYAPPAGGITYRNVIFGSYIHEDGRLLRIKFSAGSTPLDIEAAYICKRKEKQDPADTPQDGEAPSCVITFNGGSPTVTIAQDDYIWSDWIDLGGNTDKTNDYMISLYIPQHNGSQYSIPYYEDANWNGTSEAASSYCREGGDYTSDLIWGNSGTPDGKIYVTEAVEATYVDSGSYTSEVYDTALSDPNYNRIKWDIVRNNYPDANLTLRVRSDDSEEALLASSDWSAATAVNTQSLTSGDADISGIGTGRYVQFRADLTAAAGLPGEETADDYDMSCALKDVAIYWPGVTTACELSGYFTMRPNYGIFGVEIDGHPLNKGFEIILSISKDILGNVLSRSLTAEAEPRNTGK